MYINSIEDLIEACRHPYRSGEYLTDGTQVFTVSNDQNENQALIESYDENELEYHVNWDDNYLFTEEGTQIKPVY